jgi:nucleoside-diphosphate-sugar epimerase
MTELLHSSAKRLWATSLRHDDRVLVVGASGWFGRTAVALLDGLDHPRLFIASRARDIKVGKEIVHCEAWDSRRISQFAPTIIVDCAFLTRDLVESMPLEDYIERNTDITTKLLTAAALESVRRVMTVSSGAAVFPVDARSVPIEVNPYGHLKRLAEESLSTLADERGISAIVARAWSVSGAFVQKPRSYAFSDMILQALDGEVTITARANVYRRYVSVEDLLSVSLAVPELSGSRLIDSGGQLVEMQELAERIVSVVNPRAAIIRAERDGSPDNRYYASESSWAQACAETGFTPAELDAQISTARDGLLVG